MLNASTCVHGTTKMTTFEMVSKNNRAIPNNNNELPNFPMFLKFQVGDFVRVPDKRNSFSKSKLFKENSINENF